MSITARVKDVDTKDDGAQVANIELNATFVINGNTITKPLPYGNITLQIPKDSPINGSLTAGQAL